MTRGFSTPPAGAAPDSGPQLAAVIKALLARGDTEEARSRFDQIVVQHQRRASRIAFHYLRDVADADEAVQDAFVKAFVHLPSFREELPFEVWFTRILINGCLDRLKARSRRDRWLVGSSDTAGGRDGVDQHPGREATPEDLLLLQERQARIADAVARLPERQRTVVLLAAFDGRSAREVGQLTGLNESTVRVHLFRAIRTLRKMLGAESWLAEPAPARLEAGRR